MEENYNKINHTVDFLLKHTDFTVILLHSIFDPKYAEKYDFSRNNDQDGMKEERGRLFKIDWIYCCWIGLFYNSNPSWQEDLEELIKEYNIPFDEIGVGNKIIEKVFKPILNKDFLDNLFKWLEANSVYDEILKIDPTNEIALNNKKFILNNFNKNGTN